MQSAGEIETLIARVALGDREAFASLYDLVSPQLFGITLRVIKQRAAAEDAMQETFTKIWRNADRYQANGYSPMAWLVTIARNTAIDSLRARQKVQFSDFEMHDLPSPEPTAEQRVVAQSELGRITDCMDELQPRRREAIRLAYLDGESYAGISEQMDVPLNTIRTWLRRGLMSLRECMSR